MLQIKNIICFSILCIVFLIENTVGSQVHRLVRVDRLRECNRSKNAAMALSDIQIENPPGQNVILQLTAEFYRDLRDIPKMEIYVTRCRSKESLDTCVPFTVLKPLGTCELVVMKNVAWSDFVEALHPPLTCPFKKGVYRLINGTANADLFKFFPIDNYYWKVRFDFIEDKDYLSVCVDIRAILVYV